MSIFFALFFYRFMFVYLILWLIEDANNSVAVLETRIRFLEHGQLCVKSIAEHLKHVLTEVTDF